MLTRATVFNMKFFYNLILLLSMTAVCMAQETATGQATLTVHSSLVMVPVFVNTKGRYVVFNLKAEDFVLTDNGVPQRHTQEEDPDSRPLAWEMVVEPGGGGAHHPTEYRKLESI